MPADPAFDRDEFAPPTATAPPSLVAAARRRWPWAAVGLVLGLAGGFLGYTLRPEVFQSSASVLVLKKRSDIGPTSDSRLAVLEDYVATQVQLLTSERILNAAARRLPGDLAVPLPADERARTETLKAILIVAREKDPTSPTLGTNILRLSLRSAHPEDAQKVLRTVIDAYQKELQGIYDAQTQRKLDEYNRTLSTYATDRDRIKQERDTAQSRLTQITREEPTSVRGRISRLIEESRRLELDKQDAVEKLALITKAAPDQRSRRKVLLQLGDAGRAIGLNGSDLSNPDNVLKQLELERTQQFKKYGADHAVIEQLDARIQFLKELNAKYNPRDPEEEADPLVPYREVMHLRLRVLIQQMEKTAADLRADQDMLLAAAEPIAAMERCDRQYLERQKAIDEIGLLKTQTEITRDTGGYEATVINAPALGAKVEPRLSSSLLLGAAVGLFLGIALGALAEVSDKSFRTPAEIRARLGVPVLGHVPLLRTRQPADVPLDVDPSVVAAVRPRSVEAEAYRGLRTAIYFSTHGCGHQVIQVTSPNPGDGKSTLAANLAVAVAQSGKRVALLDCDFRKPRIDRIFRLADSGPGLPAVIAGEVELSAAAVRTPVENLTLYPCGPRPSNPAELLTSSRFQAVLDRLKAEYELVIVDTPPLLAVSDPAAVAPRADGVLLVFRMSSRARPAAERAREQLSQIGANLIGVVVNGTGGSTAGYDYGYADDYHSYDAEYTDDADPLPRKG